MAATLDFSKFNFTAEQIRSVNELVMEKFITSPELGVCHTIYPNIKYDKQIGFIGEGGLVGKARQGCNPTPHAWGIASRALTWTPNDWEILIHDCYIDLKSTAAVYALNSGTRQPDFTDTDYMAIMVTVLLKAMHEMVWRLTWFGDEDADVIANGGRLTAGTDKSYFNLLNGFWKQILVQGTANSAQVVTISENAGSTYATQALPKTSILGYLEDLTYKAPMELRDADGGLILCTQSAYDAYEKAMTGTAIESMYQNLVNGARTLPFRGIPLVPIKAWDKLINKYLNTGTALYKPHRMLYTTKQVLGIGVDSTEELDSLDIWYNKDDRYVKVEGMGTIDAKLMNPNYFMAAY